MLSDITIGQYFSGSSVLHRADAKIKLILTMLYIFMLFSVSNKLGLIVGIFVTILGYAVAKIPFIFLIRSIKPLIPIIIFTSIINLFFIDGEIIFSLWILKITKEGVIFAITMAIRLICLISGTSLLTYTTTPIELTDGIESLLSPLKKLHFPVHELAMMMTIALRFIPTLIDETNKIINAQKARGADFESGGLLSRAKALVPILIPLFLSAFRRADELALAMECRCYVGGEGRTKMRQSRIKPLDIGLILFMIVCVVLVFVINVYSPFVL